MASFCVGAYSWAMLLVGGKGIAHEWAPAG